MSQSQGSRPHHLVPGGSCLRQRLRQQEGISRDRVWYTPCSALPNPAYCLQVKWRIHSHFPSHFSPQVALHQALCTEHHSTFTSHYGPLIANQIIRKISVIRLLKHPSSKAQSIIGLVMHWSHTSYVATGHPATIGIISNGSIGHVLSLGVPSPWATPILLKTTSRYSMWPYKKDLRRTLEAESIFLLKRISDF